MTYNASTTITTIISVNTMTKQNIDRFGEKALSQGFVTQDQLGEALTIQKSLKSNGKDHVKLGMLMIDLKLINLEQMGDILGNKQLTKDFFTEDAARLTTQINASLPNNTQRILFTGANNKNGTSKVSNQIALGLSMIAHHNVLLIDANFHSPIQHEKFNIDRKLGLAELLESNLDIEQAIHDTGFSNLSLMPAGNNKLSPINLFTSEPFNVLMDKLSQKYQRIIFDAPPILSHPETLILAGNCDLVVNVAKENVTTQTQLKDIKKTLQGLKTNLLGTILTT